MSNSRNRNTIKNSNLEKTKNVSKPDTSKITFQARNGIINKAKQQSANALIMVIAGSVIIVNIVICSSFGTGGGGALDQPNFFNLDAYVLKNPYAQSGLYGQCIWFAWGRFYELYGYSPGFTDDEWHCAEQLVAAHLDKWEPYDTPIDLCVFSGVGFNHVGIVLYYHNGILTIQPGNMDGETNTFEDATKDWCEMQISLEDIQERYDGVIFAVPK